MPRMLVDIFICVFYFHMFKGLDVLAIDGNGILLSSRRGDESLEFILERENSSWILILLIHTVYFTAAYMHFLNLKAGITGSLKLLKLVLQGCEATM